MSMRDLEDFSSSSTLRDQPPIDQFQKSFEARCHCPHMMGMTKEQKPAGPSPPSSLPEGDKGWDFDPTGAPGAVPNEHYIQTTFIYRSENKAQKDFAILVLSKLREIRERLRQQARVTVDNEAISCVEDSEHYRCADFQQDGVYHYLIVEDSALSRHSPQSLVIYASEEAEHEVGFVRKLSAQELKVVAPKPVQFVAERFSYTELNLIDTDLLELRSGDGLTVIDHRLSVFNSQDEFDAALKGNKYVFVLFWSHVHTVSLHTFNLWARTSKISKFGKDVLLCHVECHNHADFCNGLSKNDFHTVVAYRDGQNIGSTYHLQDERYYLQWMQLMISGPYVELKTEETIKNAKKGLLFDSTPHPVVIGTFPDKECLQFQHFSIVSDRLYGRYHIAIIIKPRANATVSAYRPNEKKRRRDYEGKFDPASLMAFISVATFPSVIDISLGFTTNLLFRQPRLVAILVAGPTFDNTSYANLAARTEVRKSVIFTQMNRNHDAVGEVLKTLGLPMQDEPQVLLLDKLRVYHFVLNTSSTADEIWSWIQTSTDTPAGLLSVLDPHPLRILQKAHVDRVFTPQDTIILADETLYKDSLNANTNSAPIFTGATNGGCPFMAGGLGETVHEEL
ncbi:hypothetical protein DICVIV_01330 [Dictyocaulus viviparus]|uniref:Uncharacterized protein n=1 Tax=Dictyocaulus viviparus TaxID=29172 RepID=A0A0D8Y910_DICVI|nr:hypothetical protein DICVIV_01330 [Dictyocaulus viviparus]